ncbi:tRNA(Ile)-lysidine synthase [Sulfitobacter undariae]|uniref:tRNA(Ile)-lysidine synthase n=1 Tax=Sulfitobacter undariae TaxID=1563671 RepID=A0A7W6E196_9RHOB|nr:tRNA lysidine(34) synthetase TilS [Sulfitobacter undariae]MBB3992860.1 tRNA(Ile)-lysidine synthase [Sulfitobacter undariae]
MQLDVEWAMQQGEDAPLLHAVDVGFGAEPPKRIGIAVSGGGDSVALLHLFARWSAQCNHPIAAVTVDHGLRPESRAEAEGVAALCQKLGVSHDILTWERPEGAGNLPAAARDGRYALMADWAKAHDIGGIAVGHTIDDGAENFIMRLGRAAGIDGLAQMVPLFERYGLCWARPLWQFHRGALRDYLLRQDVSWAEDPSNDDPRYLRTKARRLLPQLKELGVDAQSIQQSASALRMAQSALQHYTVKEAETHVKEVAGDILIPQVIVPHIPSDIERRLLVAAVQWVGSNPYPPRKEFATTLEFTLSQQQRLTVAGCLVALRKGFFHITREYNAVKDLAGPTDAVWDTRWRLHGPHAPDLEVRALGEAVSELPDWRATGLPRPTLMASPAVWRGKTLVAAPLAKYNVDWTAQIVADFTSFLLSH